MCDVYDGTAQIKSFSVYHSVITIYTRSRIISSYSFYSDHNIIFDNVLTQLCSFTASSDSDVAAERMGIRCVGANLGRTAEFTVKLILHALFPILKPCKIIVPLLLALKNTYTL